MLADILRTVLLGVQALTTSAQLVLSLSVLVAPIIGGALPTLSGIVCYKSDSTLAESQLNSFCVDQTTDTGRKPTTENVFLRWGILIVLALSTYFSTRMFSLFKEHVSMAAFRRNAKNAAAAAERDQCQAQDNETPIDFYDESQDLVRKMRNIDGSIPFNVVVLCALLAALATALLVFFSYQKSTAEFPCKDPKDNQLQCFLSYDNRSAVLRVSVWIPLFGVCLGAVCHVMGKFLLRKYGGYSYFLAI